MPEPIREAEVKEKANGLIQRKIDKYAIAYEVDPKLVDCILFHESTYRFDAIGDNGKAVGCAQFHLSTWQWFRSMMGKPIADTRTNPDDAIETLAWGLANGYENHWTALKFCQ